MPSIGFGGTWSSSRPAFWRRIPSAESSKPGAMTASYEFAAISRAVGPSRTRFTPTIAPNEATGSVSSARR